VSKINNKISRDPLVLSASVRSDAKGTVEGFSVTFSHKLGSTPIWPKLTFKSAEKRLQDLKGVSNLKLQ